MKVIFENEIDYKQYIADMDRYIQDLIKLRKENPEQAKKQAEESLERSGILTENGTMKKEICS